MSKKARDPLETSVPARRKVVKGMLIALGAGVLMQPRGGVAADAPQPGTLKGETTDKIYSAKKAPIIESGKKAPVLESAKKAPVLESAKKAPATASKTQGSMKIDTPGKVTYDLLQNTSK